jgi:hypothetical protein
VGGASLYSTVRHRGTVADGGRREEVRSRMATKKKAAKKTAKKKVAKKKPAKK